MNTLSPAHPEERLTHLAQQFAQWRQSRTTPRGRIPPSRWAQAVSLSQVLPYGRSAKRLGLTPQVLKRRRAALDSVPVPALPRSPHFMEVQALPWHLPTAEVEVQRSDGTRLRITYHDASPALVPLLHTFLETP